MRIREALANVRGIYIEAAPLIYYVEENSHYVERVDAIIAMLASRHIEAVSSVITLTEVLNQPIKLGRTDLVQAYRDILLHSNHFRLVPVSAETAETAANLRARYGLRTPDALHVATALETQCEVFLTNDVAIKRVSELQVLVVDDLEFDE